VALAQATVGYALAQARSVGYGMLEIDAMIVELQLGATVGADFAEGAAAILTACEQRGYGLGAGQVRELVRFRAAPDATRR
jgi:hypothetical protein